MNWLIAAALAGQDADPAAPAEAAAEPVLRIGLVLVAAVLATLWWRKRRGWSRGTAAVVGGQALLLALAGLPTPAQLPLDLARASIWSQVGPALSQPLLWGLLLSGIGMLLMLPRSDHRQRMQGAVAGIVSLGFFAASVPALAGAVDQAVFWALAAVTLISAAAAVSMRSAVYCAIWFALSLLGTAGLFFYQGSQFLGVATIVVYAGAIVVTFLFVVMLAQPEGHSTYDRLTWGSLPKPLSVIAAALLVGTLAFAVSGANVSRVQVLETLAGLQGEDGPLLPDDQVVGVRREGGGLVVTVRQTLQGEQAEAVERQLRTATGADSVSLVELDPRKDVLHRSHMALLGSELFGRHLLSVELAGTLLLAALVGAISMAIQGKDLEPPEERS